MSTSTPEKTLTTRGLAIAQELREERPEDAVEEEQHEVDVARGAAERVEGAAERLCGVKAEDERHEVG